MKRALLWVSVTVACTLGCAGSEDAFRSTVTQRAAFDMSCKDVSVQNIGGDSYGVLGCDRKASYTCVCMYHVWFSCTKPVCTLDGTSNPATAH